MTQNELARAIAEHMLAKEATGPAWGIEIVEARAGCVKLAMRVRPDMLNGYGIVHGGMIFALADTAFAYACNARNVATLAQHCSVTFLAQGKPGARLIAEARELSVSGRSGVYSVSVRDEEGGIVAEFQGLSRTVGGAVLPVPPNEEQA